MVLAFARKHAALVIAFKQTFSESLFKVDLKGELAIVMVPIGCALFFAILEGNFLFELTIGIPFFSVAVGDTVSEVELFGELAIWMPLFTLPFNQTFRIELLSPCDMTAFVKGFDAFTHVINEDGLLDQAIGVKPKLLHYMAMLMSNFGL